MIDYQAIATAVWQQEITTHRYALAGDIEATRRLTAPDLIHIAVDGASFGIKRYLALIAGSGDVSTTAIRSGPVEALLFSPTAVLLTYPMIVDLEVAGVAQQAAEQASVLWVKRGDAWQTLFIHATTLAEPSISFANDKANGQLTHVLIHDTSAPPATENTLSTRRQEALTCERAAVEMLRRHDVSAAAAATHPDCLLVETDGSRQGRDTWLTLIGDPARTLHAMDFHLIEVVALAPHAMLVVYDLRSEGEYAGTPFTLAETCSAIWVWQGGKWQCVFMQVALGKERA